MSRLKGNTVVQPKTSAHVLKPGRLPAASEACARFCKLTAADAVYAPASHGGGTPAASVK